MSELYRISSIGTVRTFLKVGSCSEALCNVLNRAFDNPLKLEEHASMTLAGGIMQHGYQCGQIWGAVLAAGAQAYRLYGPGPEAETHTIMAAQRLVESFHARNNNINCLELTEIEWQKSKQILRFFLKGGPIRCFRMAATYAPIAYNEINASLAENHIETLSSPVSCAAMVAQKMGVSDMHTVMASGLAGGIGLCGGACGALGAAIWIIGLNSGKKPAGKTDFKNPIATDTIERFLKCSDYKFECSEIVGRKFINVNDHAGYLRGGGCSEIIKILSSK